MNFRPMQHKFRAKSVEKDGIKFPSQMEWRYYEKLKVAKAHGDLLFFLRQVPFHLPGNTKYVVDFVEFWAPKNGEPGEVRFIDVKGMSTPMFIMKKKQVEELYPIEITVVSKV